MCFADLMILESHPFPIAGAGDWFGIIFFIVVALLSSLGKKKDEDEELPNRPIRRVSPPAPKVLDETEELADQMRRYLHQAREIREHSTLRRGPLPPPPQASTPREGGAPSVAPSFSPKPLPPPISEMSIEEEVQKELPSRPLVRLEASSSNATSLSVPEVQEEYVLQEFFETSHPNLSAMTVPPEGLSFELDRTLLHSSHGLRQSFVVAEILGRPRAFTL